MEGTYNTEEGRGSEADCVVCEAGSYCDATKPWNEEPQLCAGGFICEVAAFTKYPFDIRIVDI